MQILTETEILAQWDDILDHIENEPIAVQRDGKIVSFMLGVEFIKSIPALEHLSNEIAHFGCPYPSHTPNAETAHYLNLPDDQKGLTRVNSLDDLFKDLED